MPGNLVQFRQRAVVSGAELRPGDTIRLDFMPDDPDPIPPGSIGTVLTVQRMSTWHQIDVDWECNRSLALAIPPDRVTLIYRME